MPKLFTWFRKQSLRKLYRRLRDVEDALQQELSVHQSEALLNDLEQIDQAASVVPMRDSHLFHSDIENKHAEAAEQENSATKPPRGWGKRSDDAGKRDDRDDRKRKRAILNKQSDKFAERRNPVYHHGAFRHAIAMRHLPRWYAC